VAAAEEGVARELLSSSSGLPEEVLLERLSQRLHANRGVSSDLARWSVESWAIALGVVAGGSTLATFKMDGLIPLIDLAGADGGISAAELEHLILEAKTRGVSEADARAYLSNYATSRGWQVGAVPQTPPSPAPQPQAFSPPGPAIPQPAPDRTFRWIAVSVIGLAAIVLIVLVARVTEQPQLPPPATAPIPAPAPAAPIPDTGKQQQAERERRAYNAARGNISALQVYLNGCTVCAFAPDARSEIAALETPKPETLSPGTDTRYRQTACSSIADTKTGLQWYLGPDTNISWTDAAQWVRQLPTCGGGWVLPSLAQLKTLFDQTVTAGTGFYTDGRNWPAHMDPIFSAIGRGSWVWTDGSLDNSTAPAINFNQGIGVRLSTSDPRYTVRAFAVKVLPSSPSQPAASYAQGTSDWRTYKVWFEAQTGDRRAGASYWAANRNVANHKSCGDAAFDYLGSPGFEPRGREGYIADDDLVEFGAGCQAAKSILDPIDARRADLQYRAGFNDEAQRLPINANLTPASSPAVPQPAGIAPQGTTAAYARGVADWDALRTWFNLQAGDRRAAGGEEKGLVCRFETHPKAGHAPNASDLTAELQVGGRADLRFISRCRRLFVEFFKTLSIMRDYWASYDHLDRII